MNDLTYREALGAAAPSRVVLGPAPCITCGAWVEWAGVAWLNAGTDGEHDCTPFLEDVVRSVVVAEWTRPTRRPYLMAHPAPTLTPRWLQVALALAVLTIAAAVGLVVGQALAVAL